MKKFIIKFILFSIFFTFFTNIGNALYYAPSIKITDITVAPDPVNFNTRPSVGIIYKTNTEGYITITVLKKTSSTSTKKIGTFLNSQFLSPGAHSFYWNGKHGADSQMGTINTKVDNGIYIVEIKGVNAKQVTPGQPTTDTQTAVFTVEMGEPSASTDTTSLKITNLEANKEIFSPWKSEKVEFMFEINKDADITFKIFDENNVEVKTLKNNVLYVKGAHKFSWDGKNSKNEIVEEGEYTYKITASIGNQTDADEGKIDVKKDYTREERVEDPSIEDYYATKEEFDPEWEYTYIIFNLTSKADIKVDIYKDDTVIKNLYDEKNQPKGFYKIKWDGKDEDNGNYTFKIKVENNKGKDSVEGSIKIKKDTASSGVSNLYKDNIDIDAIPYSPGQKDLVVSFKLDKDADVSFEIRKNNKLIVKILEDEEMSKGQKIVKWDGKNEDEEYVSSGIYEYRLTAKNSHGSDIEKGKFTVIKTSVSTVIPRGNTCAGYSDVMSSYKYCKAITWAKENKIFEGYQDNTFKPYQSLSRVQAIKVVFEALKVNLLKYSNENLGFKDIDYNSWYLNYLKTALSLRIVNGYQDKTFKPENAVLRKEAMKILLETAKLRYDLEIPVKIGKPYKDVSANDWFTKYGWISKDNNLTDNNDYFFPENPMTRGEMADTLYRFHQAQLDQ